MNARAKVRAYIFRKEKKERQTIREKDNKRKKKQKEKQKGERDRKRVRLIERERQFIETRRSMEYERVWSMKYKREARREDHTIPGKKGRRPYQSHYPMFHR